MTTAHPWGTLRRPGTPAAPAPPQEHHRPLDVLQWTADHDPELTGTVLPAAMTVAESLLVVHRGRVRVALDRQTLRGYVLATSLRRHLAEPELSEPVAGRPVLELAGPVAAGRPWLQRWHPCSLVSLPLLVDGHSHGALLALTYTRSCNSDDLQTLRACAERVALRLALRDAQRQLELTRLALDAVPAPAMALDARGRVRVCNETAQRTYALSEEEALGRPLTDVARSGSGDAVEVTSLPRDGDTGLSFADRTAELEATAERDRQRSLAHMVLESLPGRACVLDHAGIVVSTNQAFDREGPLGRGKRSALPPGSDYLAWLAGTDEELHGCLDDVLHGRLASVTGQLDTTFRRRQRWTEIHATAAPEPEAAALVLHIDITARKEAELDLEHRATHDPLTGLPNRVLLVDRLTHALIRSARAHTNVGILFCDLDRFKEVNTQFGHAGGDRLLIEVGRRLQHACRTSDTVARVSGDEFVVLLEDVSGPPEVEEVADRILESLAAPVDLDGGEARTGASIGLVLSPGVPRAGMASVQRLVAQVDAAMYAAKDAGRNRFAWFSPEMLEREHARPNFLEAMARRFLSR